MVIQKQIKGKAWCFGDNINTDVIHPPQFFSLNQEKVKKGLFQGYDAAIQPNINPGDIIIAGKNFGCGSSRETSIMSLLLNEIGAIIAQSYGRIFFRNATNLGLPCFTFANAKDQEKITTGDILTLHPFLPSVECRNGQEIPLQPVGEFIYKIWEAGGLLNMLPARH